MDGTRRHFWRYYDLASDRMIRCGPDEPLPRAYVGDLQDAYQRDGDVGASLPAVQALEPVEVSEQDVGPTEPLTRDDLHLVGW